MTRQEANRILDEMNRLASMLYGELLSRMMQDEFAADIEKWTLTLSEHGYCAIWMPGTRAFRLSSFSLVDELFPTSSLSDTEPVLPVIRLDSV